MGNVVEAWPEPELKKAMMNSSTDRVNESKPPASTPGKITGSSTRRKVVNQLAPRSIEASRIE
ncbi:hypothetical protein D3C81_2003510 [compost metagenome]